MAVSCIPSSEPSELSFLRDVCTPIVGPDAVDQISATLAAAHGRQLRVKSSNYASAVPFQPAWAQKARDAAKGNTKAAQYLPHFATYVTNAEIDVVDNTDKTFWPSDAAAPARAAAAASKSLLPCGSISALQYSHNGDSLAVASHDGSLFSFPVSCLLSPGHAVSLKAKHTAVATLGTGTNASLRMKTPITCVSWSYYEYSGLDVRLKQASAPLKGGKPSSSSASGGSGTSGSKSMYGLATAISNSSAARSARKAGVDSNTSCRLLLGCGGGLASEGDKSAWLWAATSSRTTPALILNADTVKGSPGVTPAAAFPGAVTSCCLYYLDRFAVLASGSSVSVCSFSLGQGASPRGTTGGQSKTGGRAVPQDDLARLKRKFLGDARATVVCSWSALGDTESDPAMGRAATATARTTVTHVAAHNTFRSPLIFTACADRSIRIYDVASGSTAAEVVRIPSAHSRSITHLSIPQASTYADMAPAALDCVITASTDGLTGAAAGGGPGSNGLVRLWDLRGAVCARQFAGGHSNSKLSIHAALSPDGLYLATGSEDRAVVIYDTRTEKVLCKLRGASDAVVSVAWHPRAMQVLGGSLDGGVRSYGPDLVWRTGGTEEQVGAVVEGQEEGADETYGYYDGSAAEDHECNDDGGDEGEG